jgi:hypothetical protein
MNTYTLSEAHLKKLVAFARVVPTDTNPVNKLMNHMLETRPLQVIECLLELDTGKIVPHFNTPQQTAAWYTMIEAIRKEEKIEATKQLRMCYNLGLKESKDIIDAIWEGSVGYHLCDAQTKIRLVINEYLSNLGLN